MPTRPQVFERRPGRLMQHSSTESLASPPQVAVNPYSRTWKANHTKQKKGQKKNNSARREHWIMARRRRHPFILPERVIMVDDLHNCRHLPQFTPKWTLLFIYFFIFIFISLEVFFFFLLLIDSGLESFPGGINGCGVARWQGKATGILHDWSSAAELFDAVRQVVSFPTRCIPLVCSSPGTSMIRVPPFSRPGFEISTYQSVITRRALSP